jgi:hypothetical protein
MRGNCNLLGNSPSTMLLLPISLRITRTVQWPAGAADPQPLYTLLLAGSFNAINATRTIAAMSAAAVEDDLPPF